MSRIRKVTAVRVVVPKHWHIDADDLANEIKRRCGFDSIDTQTETEETCAHCGAPWTEDSSEFNGGCCEADMADEDAREAARAVPS